MKKNLLFLLSVSLLITSCNLFNSHGKKFEVDDKSTVYYKGEGVTEAEAKILGDYFKANGIFDGKEEKAVQLTKDGDEYIVRIVIKEDVVKKDEERFKTIFWYWQDLISQGAFDGKPTRVILTDNQFSDIYTLDVMKKITVGPEHYVYLKGNSVNETEGKRIADSLEVIKFFDYTAGAVLLTKEKGSHVFRFLANETRQNDKSLDYNIVLENLKYIISKYILDNSNVDLVVIDADFNDVKNIKDPTDERKAFIDYSITGQPTETYQNTQYTNQQQVSASDDDVDGGSY